MVVAVVEQDTQHFLVLVAQAVVAQVQHMVHYM